jgi:hypothetical protein
LQVVAQVMCTNAGFHADQAPRRCGEPRFDLAARSLLPQHDRAALIEANDVERFLPISMPIVASLVGQEHVRTIPLADVSRSGRNCVCRCAELPSGTSR